MRKKIIAWALALAALFGAAAYLPPAAAADAPDTITAYLTLSVKNKDNAYEFAKAKDGTLMTAREVKVSDYDGDGKLTPYDLLACAHLQYTDFGLNGLEIKTRPKKAMYQVKKLWDIEDTFTFLAEDIYLVSTTNKGDIKGVEIKDGVRLAVAQGVKAQIQFFCNADLQSHQPSWSNAAHVTAKAGQPFSLRLRDFTPTNYTFGKNVSSAANVQVCYQKTGNSTIGKTTTDENGLLTVTLNEPGSYLFYSAPDNKTKASGVSVVKVLDAQSLPKVERVALSYGGSTLLGDGTPLETTYDSASGEYTVTVPESIDSINAAVTGSGANSHMYWYVDGSTDGSSWNTYSTNNRVPNGADWTSLKISSEAGNTQKLRFYLNDVSLQESNNAPLSAFYVVRILRQVALTGLETGGQTTELADLQSGNLDVYVAYNAAEATLTPTSAAGDKITVNNETKSSGETFTVPLESADKQVTVTVHRDGDGYVDRTYTVTFHKASSEAKPVFRLNLSSEAQKYAYMMHFNATPLYVFADASGKVSYQWYYNTTASTVDATEIDGETGSSYTPVISQDTIGERYYYCVATNGESNTVSEFAHIIVYPRPIKSVTWDVTPPPVPEGKEALFVSGITRLDKGYYYLKNAADVQPLYYTAEFEPWVAEEQEAGNVELFFIGETDETGRHYIMPNTSAVSLNAYSAMVLVKYKGVESFDGTASEDRIWVYTDRAANESYPAQVGLSGSGTENDPWQIKTRADLETLRGHVKNGYDFLGTYFLMVSDIKLDTTWTEPIGDGLLGARGVGWHPFSGTFDGGGNTLTYADGMIEPLFGFVREATVKNLNIKAEHLKNYALVSCYAVDYGEDGNYNIGTGGSYAPGCPDTIDIENVNILTGSVIDKGGFIGGYASGGNVVNIKNCTVQENVTIGTENEYCVGSFAGEFSGTIRNCVSYATVKGIDYVGGLGGRKGQSMGPYEISNSAFCGEVQATGNYVGGISGSGYQDGSAPNTPGVIIWNNYVSGNVTGGNYVGGILGAEPVQLQAWDRSYIQANAFYGTVKATEANAYVGGIIGYLRSLNACNFILDNYYIEGCGADKGIGAIKYLDTSFAYGDSKPEGCTVFNSTVSVPPNTSGIGLRPDGKYTRSDDPFGKDAEKLAAKKTAEEFANGTVTNLLNKSASSFRNWKQGAKGPVLSNATMFYRLDVSGTYKKRYLPGEDLDLNGISFTAVRSDSYEEQLTLKQVTVSGYDPNRVGKQELTIRYQEAEAFIDVYVIPAYTEADRANFEKAEVLFSLSEDAKYKTSTSNTVLANVPMTVSYFDLGDYGLEDFYRFDESGKLVEKPTVLHLYITALERYVLNLPEDQCGRGKLAQDAKFKDYLSIDGTSGSMHLQKFWGHDENLIYFVNGQYPLERENWGATADTIELTNGDFVDVAMFEDWSFHSKTDSGFHFFSKDGTTPQKTFRVPHGENLTLTYLIAHTDFNGAQAVNNFAPNTTVYYSTKLYDTNAKTAMTGEDGKVTLTFDKEGTWYVWTDGAKSSDKGAGDSIVSAPGCATIIVTKTAKEVEELIEKIGEVTKDSGDAIAAAREAYDSLDDATKEEVGNYKKLTDAEKRYEELWKSDSTTKIDSPNKPKKDTVAVDASKFNDVSRSDWYYNSVQYALENGLMNGTSDWTFSPNADTTRGMIVTILARLDGVNTTGNPWYAAGRTWAMNAGVSDGTNMEGKITREQLAAMLYRYAKAKGYDVSASADISGYADASSVSSWAIDAMQWAVGAGLINGRTATTLAPQGNATRAEVAAILMRFAQNIAK